jgi:hypothetical protein
MLPLIAMATAFASVPLLYDSGKVDRPITVTSVRSERHGKQ